MNALLQRRLTTENLDVLITESDGVTDRIDDEHRANFASRLRAVPHLDHRRFDAWTVERGARPSGEFAWSPGTARRILGNNALRRESDSILNAVRDEIADQLLRSVQGYARPGSLGHWLAGVSHPVLGLITAEAVNWATQVFECADGLDVEWRVAPSDVYHNVPGARTTLRGRRELIVATEENRVIVRIRGGKPGKSAGPGLRADLVAETLAHPQGVAPRRYLGLWPDAGLILGVEGTMENIRAGARDFIRAAVVQRRRSLTQVA